MNLENAPDQYLLIMFCEDDTYFENGGYCRYYTPSHFRSETFNLDDEESLVKTIADFKSTYANGDYEIYVVKNFDWYNHEEQREYLRQLGYKGEDLAKEISKEKELKEQEKRKRELEKSKEEQKQRELEQLKKLKEKYEL